MIGTWIAAAADKEQLPPIREWIAEAVIQMQRDAIRQAEEAGAVILRYVDTSFVPDGEGGYVMNTEWEMGVPRA